MEGDPSDLGRLMSEASEATDRLLIRQFGGMNARELVEYMIDNPKDTGAEDYAARLAPQSLQQAIIPEFERLEKAQRGEI
jgi:hypothetical protein